MKIVYVGGIVEPLELEDGQIVRRGEPVEVETELAERLLEQDTWERPTTKTAKATQRAAKRTPSPPEPPEAPEERAAAGEPAVSVPDEKETT